MKSRDVKYLIFLIFVLLPFFTFADSWIQTDWSGGDGYFQWQDPTGYYEGSGVNGWRKHGFLTLLAPDFEHFYSIGKLPDAQSVPSLFSDQGERYFAGAGWSTAKLYVSFNFGNSWDTTISPGGNDEEVDAILLSSFDTLFIGTGRSPGRIWSQTVMDTMWYSYNLTGVNTTSIIETVDHDIYASTAGNGFIYRSTNYGLSWSQTPGQPKIGSYYPTAVYQLIQTENEYLYAVTKCSDGRGWVFRSEDLAAHWDTCHSFPTNVTAVYSIDEATDGNIFVGTGDTDGDVFNSTDHGVTWNSCADLQNAQVISRIVVDLDLSVYAIAKVSDIGKRSFAASVFHSRDKGISWSSFLFDSTYAPTSSFQTYKGFLLIGTSKNAEIFKSAYVDSGYLVSSVYDVGTGNGSSEFEQITWQANLNGEQLNIKVRTATDSLMSNALSWNQCTYAVNGQDISNLLSVNDGDRYVQYRTELLTDSVDYSSELDEIQINFAIDSCPPHLDTAYASDGDSIKPGIDKDDYVVLVFDDSTTMPSIESDTINSVLRLSSGHSWLDGDSFAFAHWLSPEILRISWPGLVGCPTVDVGDTIYPDTLTITDRCGNPCYNPIVLTGSFGPSGITEEDLLLIEGVEISPTVSHRGLEIGLNLSDNCRIRASLFDISGRRLEIITDKRFSKGFHCIAWNNKRVPQGLYFIRVETTNVSYTKKIALIK